MKRRTGYKKILIKMDNLTFPYKCLFCELNTGDVFTITSKEKGFKRGFILATVKNKGNTIRFCYSYNDKICKENGDYCWYWNKEVTVIGKRRNINKYQKIHGVYDINIG